MTKKVYEFLIFKQDNLIYYNDLHHEDPNYEKLRE